MLYNLPYNIIQQVTKGGRAQTQVSNATAYALNPSAVLPSQIIYYIHYIHMYLHIHPPLHPHHLDKALTIMYLNDSFSRIKFLNHKCATLLLNLNGFLGMILSHFLNWSFSQMCCWIWGNMHMFCLIGSPGLILWQWHLSHRTLNWGDDEMMEKGCGLLSSLEKC